MKKILALTVAAFATVFISGCGDASKRDLQEANENLKEASQNVKQAVTDSNEEAKRKATAEWQKFKTESDSTFAAIDMQMNDLKGRIAKANKEEKARLNSELNKLEQKLNEQKAKLDQKNAEFNADMEAFNETVVTKYEAFQREFKHDNDELRNALKNLFIDNVK